MLLEIALKWSERPISFCFRQRVQKQFIKFQPNKQTRTCYATLLRFMLHRAPKLTARTFYAPLNERSSFDGLRKTARLIGKNVRRRKLIAKPNATVSVDSQGVGSGDSLCALRVGAYNEIERRSLSSKFPHLNLK